MTTELKLNQKLESLGKNIAVRESAKVYQFPLWGDPQRGVPNEFARSALFAAIKGTDGIYCERVPLFSQGNFTITYSGPRLTQDHLDVFEGIMHLAREMPEGNVVRFKTKSLLKLIGRSTGKRDRDRLLRALLHLTTAAVEIRSKDSGIYCSSLLPEWGEREEDTGYFTVCINRNLIKLFERGFTVIEWEQRKALARKPLAQALHVWLCSHEKPYPVTVQYLHDITGSQTKLLKHFRERLKVALDALKAIGVLVDWHIDEADKVHFVKA